MGLLGVYVNLLIGPTVPVPASVTLLEQLQTIEVRHDDKKLSGLAVTFQVGRRTALGVPTWTWELDPAIRQGNRIVVSVVVAAVPTVLFDGVITEIDFNPDQHAGSSTLTLRAKDLGFLMDLEEVDVQHPAQSDDVIATAVIGGYAQHGVLPQVSRPPSTEAPSPTDYIPSQRSTDLELLQDLAKRNGYVFFLEPGPVPGTSTAYWGPSPAIGVPQAALLVNMGALANVERFDVTQTEQVGEVVTGYVQDRITGQIVPVMSSPVSTSAPLAAAPAAASAPGLVRKTRIREGNASSAQALARAQARSDSLADGALRATGTLDSVRYGGVLRPRSLVDVRGVGLAHDGTWYCEAVTHTVEKGSLKQNFTLRRGGTGALSPGVMV